MFTKPSRTHCVHDDYTHRTRKCEVCPLINCCYFAYPSAIGIYLTTGQFLGSIGVMETKRCYLSFKRKPPSGLILLLLLSLVFAYAASFTSLDTNSINSSWQVNIQNTMPTSPLVVGNITTHQKVTSNNNQTHKYQMIKSLKSCQNTSSSLCVYLLPVLMMTLFFRRLRKRQRHTDNHESLICNTIFKPPQAYIP
jgi:hypothetical protein